MASIIGQGALRRLRASQKGSFARPSCPLPGGFVPVILGTVKGSPPTTGLLLVPSSIRGAGRDPRGGSLVLVAASAALLFAVACSDEAVVPGTEDVVDASEDQGAQCPNVAISYHEIDGVAAPPNPVTGDVTEAKYNRVRYIRYRADTGGAPPLPAKAIFMLLPGYTVGTGYLRYIAFHIADLSCGQVEVWLVERRHHLLEDPTGMIAAEEAGDPWIAYNYYWDGGQVDGQTFDGFLSTTGPDSAMLSEWGLDLSMQDIRSVIYQVPESSRASTVFLAGHSRGVAFVKAYAAYVFEDGTQGSDDVAGLVLIDGDSRYNAQLTEEQYVTEIERIRSGDTARYETVPPAGAEAYFYLEILGMISAEGFGDPDDPELGPEGSFPEFGPLTSLLPILFRNRDITMTNEAFMGYATDTESAIIDILRSGVGALDGPTAEDAIGLYPSDPDHLYTWLHYDEVEPHDFCEIQNMIKALYEGPSNAADPYYAARLDYDFYVADQMETEETWREQYFHLRSSTVDVPVFALGSHLLSEEPERITDYRDQLAPVRNQELPRSEYGFDIMWKPDWEHLDTVFAVAESNDFFAELGEWLLRHSGGEVLVPES